MTMNKATYQELEETIIKLENKLSQQKIENHSSETIFQMQEIIDLLVEPIFVKDNEHCIVLANKSFYDIFQLEPKDVIGSNLVDAVPENERDHFLSVDRKVLDTGEPDYREEQLTVDEQTHTILTSKKRYINDKGEHFLVGSIQDITKRKQAEQKLKDEKAKLEQALDEIQTLKGILPICSYCKNIRDDEGYWRQIEEYISKNSEAVFSHSICQDCAEKHFSQFIKTD